MKLTKAHFDDILLALRDHPELLNGVPLMEHIEWSENAGPPESADDFALEAIYVICNSGMNHKVARGIYERCRSAIERGEMVASGPRLAMGLESIFGHKGKTEAIDSIWFSRNRIFREYMAAADKVAYCGTLPWIGEITKYHLAKNFGTDVAKPDVHLERLAKVYDTTPQALCDNLSEQTGYKSRTIDLILWMACAKGVIRPDAGRLALSTEGR